MVGLIIEYINTHSNKQTQHLRTTNKMVKSTWACMGHFLYHLQPRHEENDKKTRMSLIKDPKKKKKVLHILQQNMFK